MTEGKVEKVAIPRGLTPKALGLGLFVTVINILISVPFVGYTPVYSFFPMPFVYYMLILTGLSVILKKKNIELTKQEATVFTFIAYLNGGAFYLYSTGWASRSLYTPASWLLGGFAYMNLVEPHATSTGPLVPKFWYTQNPEMLRAFWFGGLVPIDWASYAGPIAWWTAFLFVTTIANLCISLLIAKPLVRIERLPFTHVIQSANLINYYYEKKNGTPGILSLKWTTGRFWIIGVITGLIMEGPAIARVFLPTVTTEFTAFSIDTGPYLNPILPGHYPTLIYSFIFMFVTFFTPSSILLSCLVLQGIFLYLYPPIAIWTGFLPAGQSPSYYQMNGIKYTFMAGAGGAFGLFLWFIYQYRDHFMATINSALGKAKTPEEQEEGHPSYRFIWGGLLIGTVITMVMAIVSGVPLFVALWLMVAWHIYNVSLTWTTATGPYVTRPFWAHYQQPFIWDAGVASGAWAAGAPAKSTAAYVTVQFTQDLSGDAACYGTPFNTYTLSGAVSRLPYDTQTRIWDIIWALIIIVPIGTVLGLVWTISYYTPRGLANLTVHSKEFIWYNVANRNYSFNPPYNILAGDHWVWGAVGAVATFVIGYLHMKLPWFFLHPAAVVYLAFQWTFLATILTLIFRTVLLKVFGARGLTEIGFPLCTGWALGFAIGDSIVTLVKWVQAAPMVFAF